MIKCRCPIPLKPDWNYCPRCGERVIISDKERLASRGVAFLPTAFEEAPFRAGKAVAETSTFYELFTRYIALICTDPSQLVYARSILFYEHDRQNGPNMSIAPNLSLWCALSLISDQYFADKALAFGWSPEQNEKILGSWYSLMDHAFVVAEPARRLPIETIKNWVMTYQNAQRLEQGPFPACFDCTSKCFYRQDISKTLLVEPVVSELEIAIADEDENEKLAQISWNAHLHANRYLAQGSVDFSYCLVVHCMYELELDSEKRVSDLGLIRKRLEELQ